MTKTLALFDFDGTITTDDSLLKIIRFFVGNVRFLMGLIILSPVLVAFKLKIIPNYKAKQKMLSWFFKGYSERHFNQVASEYSLNHIDRTLRPKAMEKLEWHKNQGHEIVIVSASLENWLKPWCNKNGFKLISTQLAIQNGWITGELKSDNCHGPEKVNRIKQQYNLDDYDSIYAYGDSSGDKEMLALTSKAFYKPFR